MAGSSWTDRIAWGLKRFLRQDAKILTSIDHDVTNGHLCIKGRFAWELVNLRD
jgi:predicted molibdopterin-dependent oxidoreductase YjgC